MLISKTLFPSLVLIKTFSNLLKNVNFVIEKSISHLTTETKFEPLLASRPKRLFSCLKSKTLYICLFSPFSSPRSLWNIGEFEAKKYFKTIKQLIQSVICCYKNHFFSSILLLNKSQRMGILQTLLCKCSHLFICMSLK